MTQPVADAHDRTVRWRQLVDLLSRPHDEIDPALLDAIVFPLWLQSFVDQVAYWSDTPADCGCDAREQYDHPIAPLSASSWLT